MVESAERRPLVSVLRIADDTLEELSLPGLFDVLPTPSEVIHFFGLPTLNDLGESLKGGIGTRAQTRMPKFPFP